MESKADWESNNSRKPKYDELEAVLLEEVGTAVIREERVRRAAAAAAAAAAVVQRTMN